MSKENDVMRKIGVMAWVVVLGAAMAARADVWDVGSPNNDDSPTTTHNELVHGSDQLHDLAAQGGVADVDFYRMGQRAYSSYEVVVDATSATLGPAVDLGLVAADGTTSVLASTAVTTSLGFSRTLRWQNAGAQTVDSQLVRVMSTGCTTTCTADDVYRVRSYETTYSIPRWNQSGTQVTVLIIQNPTTYAITVHAYFWSGAGSLLSDQTTTLASRALWVLSAGSVPALTDKSGSITVSHNGAYGALSGKAVALEPATGFSFDSPMESVPR